MVSAKTRSGGAGWTTPPDVASAKRPGHRQAGRRLDLDLRHARPTSPFEEVVSEPASHVQQATPGDIARSELSQAVVNDNRVPIGRIRGSRWAFSCKAQASPRPFAFLLREAHLGVGADAADELHIGA